MDIVDLKLDQSAVTGSPLKVHAIPSLLSDSVKPSRTAWDNDDDGHHMLAEAIHFVTACHKVNFAAKLVCIKNLLPEGMHSFLLVIGPIQTILNLN